jgi:hypothetical protein
MFPVTLEERIPSDHVCRVIEAFVGRLDVAKAAQAALGHPESLHLVADAGYSNGEQAEACEAKGIVPHVR